FPAWFVNIIDAAGGGRRDLTLDISGDARVPESGRLTIDLDRDMTASGHIGFQPVSSTGGQTIAVPLEPGTHPIVLRAQLTGERWKFVPLWNGQDAFRATMLTVGESSGRDRWLAAPMALATAALIAALIAWWIISFVAAHRASPLLIAWCIVASAGLAAAGATGHLERLAGLLLVPAAFVPIAASHRNLRGAFMLLGVPWLAFFAARSLPQVGHFSAYSVDDWLAYQVAGYRIFMNGFWLEAGSKAFDYQPLYRWISGLLHLTFGDSSVGEVYWDATCLLIGALLCFSLV